jgi:hypothetical protein
MHPEHVLDPEWSRVARAKTEDERPRGNVPRQVAGVLPAGWVGPAVAVRSFPPRATRWRSYCAPH